jgi:hypothetical protein
VVGEASLMCNCFAILICILLLAGCANTKPVPWPIAQLTVPTEARPAPIPDTVAGNMSGQLSADRSQTIDAPNQYTWIKGFNYYPGWDKLVAHVEAAIVPLGYTRYRGGWLADPAGDGKPGEDWAKGWRSADGKYQFVLLNVGTAKGHTKETLQQNDADYVYIVNQIKGLPAKEQQEMDASGI